MPWESFILTLDKPENGYIGGEAISGNLFLKLKERINIKTLDVTITGEEDCSCFDYYDSDSGPVYTEKHGQFFSKTIQILDNKLLEPGDLNFPFYFELPTNMPPTSKSGDYSINYLIEARLIPKEEWMIPWFNAMHYVPVNSNIIKLPITILAHYDLNKNPSLKQPYGVSDESVVCCGPCKSNPIKIEFSVTKRGFVPGENVLFKINIDNQSGTELSSLFVEFKSYKYPHYYGISPRRKLCKLKVQNKAEPKSVKNWEGTLTLPETLPISSFERCKLIKLDYYLELKYSATWFSKYRKIQIPIIIGSKKLED